MRHRFRVTAPMVGKGYRASASSGQLPRRQAGGPSFQFAQVPRTGVGHDRLRGGDGLSRARRAVVDGGAVVPAGHWQVVVAPVGVGHHERERVLLGTEASDEWGAGALSALRSSGLGWMGALGVLTITDLVGVEVGRRQQPGCRDAMKIDKTRLPTLTERRSVATARSSLHKPRSDLRQASHRAALSHGFDLDWCILRQIPDLDDRARPLSRGGTL